MDDVPFPDSRRPIEDVIEWIEIVNSRLAQFWSGAHGWPPIEAAGLLGKARLDWQVSLSSSLRLWLREPPALSDGELILAWANLGALIEGTLKLFLSVYYTDYCNDIDSLKSAGAYDKKKGAPMAPDGLTLEPLRKFVRDKVLIGAAANALTKLVQQRRNAIHAFKDRPIGDTSEFWEAVRSYMDLLDDLEARLPCCPNPFQSG